MASLTANCAGDTTDVETAAAAAATTAAAANDDAAQERRIIAACKAAHISQFLKAGLPKNLWDAVARKLLRVSNSSGSSSQGSAFGGMIDGNDAGFEVREEIVTIKGEKEEDVRRRILVTKREVSPGPSAVWLLRHTWMFSKPEDALKEMKEDVGRRVSMAKLMGMQSRASADELLEAMQRYAYPIFDAEGERMHYVLEPAGSYVSFATSSGEVPNMSMAQIVHVATSTLLTVAWLTHTLRPGDVVCRRPQQRMTLLWLGTKAWEARFEYEKQYEWYLGYEDPLSTMLRKHVPQDKPVLMLGNGTSSLPIDMAKDGYRHILATDVVEKVIEAMRKRYGEHEGGVVEWKVVDATRLQQGLGAEACFPSVVDKGCLDALMVGEGGGWNLDSDLGKQAVKSAAAILETDGVYFLVSFQQPVEMCNFVETASQGALDLQACYQVERKGKARSRIGAGVKANDAYIYIFQKKEMA
eukprot:g4825.t1